MSGHPPPEVEVHPVLASHPVSAHYLGDIGRIEARFLDGD
jgi:hypothetical protein